MFRGASTRFIGGGHNVQLEVQYVTTYGLVLMASGTLSVEPLSSPLISSSSSTDVKPPVTPPTTPTLSGESGSPPRIKHIYPTLRSHSPFLLSNPEPFNVRMTWTRGHVWRATVAVPPGCKAMIKYRYSVWDDTKCGTVREEIIPPRIITVEPTGPGDFTVVDKWDCHSEKPILISEECIPEISL